MALTNQAVHCKRAYFIYLALLHFYVYVLSSLSIVRLLLRRCVRAPKLSAGCTYSLPLSLSRDRLVPTPPRAHASQTSNAFTCFRLRRQVPDSAPGSRYNCFSDPERIHQHPTQPSTRPQHQPTFSPQTWRPLPSAAESLWSDTLVTRAWRTAPLRSSRTTTPLRPATT